MFRFKLVARDGQAVETETFESAVPTWRAGDRIFVSPQLRYLVVEVRDGGAAAEPVLVVERE